VTLLLSIVLAAVPVSAGPYEVPWWTVDDGGISFGSGGIYQVGATLGQPDAGEPQTGAPFVVRGGFWALPPRADLSITKSDGQTSALPGQPLAYTIVAHNAGPAAAPGAHVSDAPPAALLGVAWTCVATPGSSCPASGAGGIDTNTDLLAGGSASFTLSGTLDPTSSGSLVNTASVSAPPGVVDPSAADNSATDTDAVTPLADLSVTKTDGQASVVPGQAVAYAIEVANGGPNPVAGATVTDTPPVDLTDVAWTCAASPGSSCPSSGTGPIDASVDLLVNGSAAFTLTGTVSPSAVGTLDNTASVTTPVGVVDPDPGDDSATDTDTLTPVADLGVSLSDSPDPVGQGHALTYTLAVTNAGPSASAQATLVQTLPPEVAFVSSNPGAPTCVPAGGTVSCTLSDIAPGASLTVTVVVTVGAGASGTLGTNVTVAGGDPDPVSGNDSDSESTSVVMVVEGELVHGTRLLADLGALPGPTADEDRYRFAQRPYSSYEVVLDGSSGDLGTPSGPALERLASDGLTVIQSSAPVGAGRSRSLRWENGATPALDELVRVRSQGCGADCGPEDVYRLRAYETTATVARFNSSGTQATALLIQNTGSEAVAGHVYFVGVDGSRLVTVPFSIVPHGLFVVSSASLPDLAGQSGSIRVAHDGRYGDLVGKAVALEPATGFTFDTPLLPRPR
jgi:uncharacterized repeat protein (TIGR01451 family)